MDGVQEGGTSAWGTVLMVAAMGVILASSLWSAWRLRGQGRGEEGTDALELLGRRLARGEIDVD